MRNHDRLKTLLAKIPDMDNDPPDIDVRTADARDGKYYNINRKTEVALQVALITGRPLLIVGPPGCGKSSLMPFVAKNLDLAPHTYTVTETSEASDLLWNIDHLERLNDSNKGLDKANEIRNYVQPGVLWRAFRPDVQSSLREDYDSTTSTDEPREGAVVLIDEIDKADSGFANSLLVAIGSLQIDVPASFMEDDNVVKADEGTIVLVIITSNDERELPPALVRRCITLDVCLLYTSPSPRD